MIEKTHIEHSVLAPKAVETGITLVGGELCPYIKIGNQTFYTTGFDDEESAVWSLHQLRIALGIGKKPLDPSIFSKERTWRIWHETGRELPGDQAGLAIQFVLAKNPDEAREQFKFAPAAIHDIDTFYQYNVDEIE